MISLRYHLLSLVSVFLALAIGILIGSAFVMRADLRSISQRLQKEFSEVREEVRKERETSRQIEAILGNYRRFAQSVIPLLVRGRLAGQRIGIIYIGNVEDKVISELEETIEAAGGQVSFLISLLPSQIRNLSEGYEEFFVSLSNDLLWGNKRGLEYLAGQNLINIKSWQGTTTKLLVISDKEADKNRVKEIDIPLISNLLNNGFKVVGGEEFASSFSVIPYYKDQGISTIDCVDYEIGRIGVVLLLSGKEGNYGMRKGTDALLPPL